MTSWEPLDLEPVLDGGLERPRPTILQRTDGAALLYRSRVHLVVGASEAGKTFLALAAIAEVVRSGERAIFVDLESDEHDIVRRLVDLGCRPDQILDRLDYVRPEDPITADADSIPRLIGEDPPAIVVIDGLSELFALHGRDSRHEIDVATMFELTARPFARAWAAVALLDHVPHDGEREIGSQHKRSGVDVSLLVKADAPWTPGRENVAEVFRLKDRPGGLDWRPVGKRRKVAHVVASPSVTGGLDVVLYPPLGDEARVAQKREATEAQRRVLTKVTAAWETSEMIASRVGRAVRTVQDHLQALYALDLVELRERPGSGAVTAFEYRLRGADDGVTTRTQHPRREAVRVEPDDADASSQVNTTRNHAERDAVRAVDDREDARRGPEPGARRAPVRAVASASSGEDGYGLGRPEDMTPLERDALEEVQGFLGAEPIADPVEAHHVRHAGPPYHPRGN